MSFDLAHPDVALPYCFSYFLMKRYRKVNYLLQVGPSKIQKEWKLGKSEQSPSICMDTESNLMDTKEIRAVMMIDGKMSMLNRENKIENLTSKPSLLEFDHFIGIFDRNVLFATKTSEQDFTYELIDLDGKLPQKKIILDRNILKNLFHCTIPSNDVSNRKYSVNGLFYGLNFFLFNRKSRDFELFSMSDESMFNSVLTSSQHSARHSNIPFKEGNSIRSFYVGDQRLVEIIFENETLLAREHLPWINNIRNTIAPSKFGIIFFAGNNEIYRYRPALSNENIHEGKYQKVNNISQSEESSFLWSDELKYCLFYSDLECKSVSVDFDSVKWLPYWSEEEIQKEFSVKTYQMEIHPKINILSKETIRNMNDLKPFRGNAIYHVGETARISDFVIVRGIKCREYFPQFCSEDYQEITDIKEFSNYLGAPIYSGNQFGFVFEVLGGDLKIGSYSLKYNSFLTQEVSSLKLDSFGIVESILNQTLNIPRVKLDDEWIKMMKRNEFLIESGKIKVIDFTTDRDSESSLIENVKNGLWIETHLTLSGTIRQILVYNQEYQSINCKISKDWETPGNIFDSNFDTFDMEIKHGWHVSSLVGLDHGIGIVDAEKFNDNNLFTNTNLERLEWNEGIEQIRNEFYSRLDCFVFPFGVYCESGMGDGIYPCLYKMHEGKVVAVKVAFQRHGNARLF